MLKLESSLLKADHIEVFRHGVAGILPETTAKIGFIEVERLQNVIKTNFQKFIHMEPSQQFSEPHGVIGIVVANAIFHQVIQKGNA